MSGNPDNVQAGPGWLYVAPFGTVEPANATLPLGGAYKAIGYTEDGTTFSHAITREDMLVAEEVDPIKGYTTKRDTMVKFAMAESTARNLLLALNGGLVDTPALVEAPEANSEVYVSLVHETESGARWIYRKCLQVGTVELSSKKAPAKKLVPVEFKLYLPGGGLKLFTAWPDADGLV